jgi:hypothetical protein
LVAHKSIVPHRGGGSFERMPGSPDEDGPTYTAVRIAKIKTVRNIFTLPVREFILLIIRKDFVKARRNDD